jgi:HD-GYP domain-containing protein (c-di-GMP phosphodiesterase class II)
MRACLLAVHLGRRLGLHESDLFDAYYATLLRFVGCTATSTAYAAGFAGDDVDVRRAGDLMDPTVPGEALGFLWTLSRRTGATRPLQFARMLSHAPTLAREGAAADCEVGSRLVARFGFAPPLQTALLHSFERWDGHGAPRGTKGEAIPLPSRLATLGFAAVMFDAVAGRTAAVQTVRRWSGRIIDPSLAHVFLQAPDEHLDAASPDDAWEAVVAAEPGKPRLAGEATLEAIARGFADVADLKSRFLAGHSSGVGKLAELAGRHLGLNEPQIKTLRWAGLLHDIGRVGIATGVWDKPVRLTRADWEEVRLHPYHTQRILSRVPALSDVARVAAQHHERLGGGGYPAGLDGRSLDVLPRVLAAADVFHALQEDRPHRPAISAAKAAATLRDLSAAAGELDPNACAAVLAAAGQPPLGRRQYPAGLTEREVEVLQLLARGSTEREIAERLVISAGTTHTHVVHIYEKAGVSTRAGVTLFALEHDLIARLIHMPA